MSGSAECKDFDTYWTPIRISVNSLFLDKTLSDEFEKPNNITLIYFCAD